VVLEVIPTEERKTERARNQKEKRDKRNMTKEEEHEIKEKYAARSGPASFWAPLVSAACRLRESGSS
jgi:hypothetical protein